MPYLIYPLILCLIPIHSLYAQNQSEISKDNYIRTTAAISFSIIFLYGVLAILTHNAGISGLIICINFYLLLYANYIYIGMFSKYKRQKRSCKAIYIFYYIIVCIIISLSIYVIFKEISLVFFNKLLFYISSIITFFICLDINNKSNISKQAIKEQSYKSKHNKQISSKPDIYHILLDGHDGFSNKKCCDKEFKIALQNRGFHIYENFSSNYGSTAYSVPSMLNLDYIQNLIRNQNSYTSDITYPLYAESFVHNELEDIGYTCNFFINKVMQPIFDKKHYKDKFKKYTQIENLLIFSSIFKLMLKNESKILGYPNDFIELVNAFENDEINEGPQYKFMHTLAPHRPYFFDEFGNNIKPSEYFDDRHVLSYTKYVDKNIIKLIDKIKSKMKENSIIMLHSDHPTIEGLGILCAIYFPNADDYKCIPEKGSLVNLFRFLFNKLFLTEYELLNDKFYTMDNKNHTFKEVDRNYTGK